jgi:hypothetical protein
MIHRHVLPLVLFAGFASVARGQADDSSSAGRKSDGQEILVGINYFAGWWKPLPNKWHGRDGEDWRPKFPERVPRLGEYNDQPTMDREIAAAAEHGVDFFAILWYPVDPEKEQQPHVGFLERGVTCFMNSPQARRMKFMLEFCNHPPFLVETGEDWNRCVEYWVKVMRHPSYLRVGGRLVFKVHSGGGLIQQCGGDVNLAQARLDQLRAAVRKAGLGEMLIGAGFSSRMEIPEGHWAARLFDFSACYMDVPPLEQKEEDYPFDTLAEFTNSGRRAHGQDAIAYLPYLAAGWNPRPWPDNRAAFALPTAAEWLRELRRMKSDLEQIDRLGLPLDEGQRQMAFTIYAWNEFGEGGFVAPTAGENMMKLEAIRQVFGPSSSKPESP